MVLPNPPLNLTALAVNADPLARRTTTMKCTTCGAEHDLLDPSFSRPDVIFTMSADDKRGRVFENNDLCALRGEGGAADRPS